MSDGLSQQASQPPLAGTTGGGSGPAGASYLVDATGALDAAVTSAEALNTQGETQAFDLDVIQPGDTLAAQAEAVSLELVATGETLSTATEAQTMQAIYAATTTWTAPAGVTSVTVECWGGGGGAANGTAASGGTGAGGGSYARSVLAVTPSTAYTVTVGAAVGAATAGNPSWFNTSATIFARGGGTATANIGTVTFLGGTPAAGVGLGAGGGGSGAAGSSSAGGNATGVTAGTGGATGGGNGGNGGASGVAGVAGSAPGGGGGGGGFSATSPGAGGGGAVGRVSITWNT